MRRIASLTVILALVIGTVSVLGCNKPVPKQDMQSPSVTPEPATHSPDYFAGDPAGTMPAGKGSTEMAYQAPTAATPQPAMTSHSSGGPTMHKVGKGDTLYGIARKYYNDGKRWKDIAKANNITADKLRLGQELVIP